MEARTAMTLDPRRRARKLARKAAKRRARLAEKQRSGYSPGSMRSQMVQAQAAAWPLHESYIPARLLETGLGSVIISRRMGSQFAVGVFLVDAFCLGVKNAFLSMASAEGYDGLLNRCRERAPLVPVKPECARKLVEGAVEYAADLGFSPHKDYHAAKAIFGAIDAALCETAFHFGHEGKPLYCSGPWESPARREQIIDMLRKRCGPDGFHFLVGMGDSGFDESDDSESGDDSDG